MGNVIYAHETVANMAFLVFLYSITTALPSSATMFQTFQGIHVQKSIKRAAILQSSASCY